jgi:predicted Zn-dependent protease
MSQISIPSIRIRVLTAVTLLALMVGCAKVPVTGRSQLSLIPSSEMMSMSAQQYGEFMKQNPPSKDAAGTAQVKRVGLKIQQAVEAFAKEKGFESRIANYQWEFNLVDSKDVNAWCMPGGKVVVYSGLLPVAKDDAGLAVVMGHEIAHAVAEHGGERMSQQMMAQMGGVALGEALKTKPAATQQLWMTAFGVGAQYGALMPFSRQQESEADRLGLVFMSIAGYDPRTAPAFWERMAAGKAEGGAPPEFMSTHPSDATRIKKLNEQMPEAMQYYKPAAR